jgi:Nucleotidyl transferase AbiEii toxin, Type IV TA system
VNDRCARDMHGLRENRRDVGKNIRAVRDETLIDEQPATPRVAVREIEVAPVLRGCVYEPAVRPVSARVEAEFGFAEMSVVSFADLYGGKIVAALEVSTARHQLTRRRIFI